jgi:hypothetical protein
MADTPGGAFPIISDTTVVRFRASALVTLIVGVFGAGGWATWMTFKVDSLDSKVTELLQEIRAGK